MLEENLEEELSHQIKCTVDLLMLDNNKFVTRCIRQYLQEQGIKVKPGDKGLQEAKNYLDSVGWELEIKMTNLDIEEQEEEYMTAKQMLRLKLKPKLEG